MTWRDCSIDVKNTVPGRNNEVGECTENEEGSLPDVLGKENHNIYMGRKPRKKKAPAKGLMCRFFTIN